MPTPAAIEAVSLEQFRQHLHRIDSLGQRMKVRPMRGHESVLRPQVWTHDGRDHLLTDAEMHLTVNLARLDRRPDALFQQAHAKHGLVQLAGSEHATNPGRPVTARLRIVVRRLGDKIENLVNLGVYEEKPDWLSMLHASLVPKLYDGNEFIRVSMN